MTQQSVAACYGWLGTHQKQENNLSGLVLMGVRVYNPVTGTFTESDAVLGGNANPYTYPGDPVNGSDLTGKFHICWFWCPNNYTVPHFLEKHWRGLAKIATTAVGVAAVGAICVGTVTLGCVAALGGIGVATGVARGLEGGAGTPHFKPQSLWLDAGVGLVSGYIKVPLMGLGITGKSALQWLLKRITDGL